MTPAIASIRNPLVKEIRRALAKGTLTADGCAVAETFHLLEEALRSDCEVPAVLAAEIVEQLTAALEEFRSVEEVLG